MPAKQRKPAWFILYVLVFLMIAIFVLESKDGLPNWANEFASFVIVLIVFGAMALWVHVNMPALMDEERRKNPQGELHIHEYPPVKPPQPEKEDDKVRKEFS